MEHLSALERLSKLAEGVYDVRDILKRRKGKGNVGQKDATKVRNRRNNRLARKNRRLNLRRGM